VAERYVSLFAAAALRWAGRVAVVGGDETLTYAQLDGRASGLARALAGRGIPPGGRLALAIGNRAAFAVALLGALRRGLTVAPLDVRLTPEERRAVLENLKPSAIVDGVDGGEAAWPDDEGDAPALVLYTSGSTGAPKGAVLSQAALVAGVRSWLDVLALTPDDVVLAVLPLSHSYGLNGALLAPLIAGARVVVLERFTPAGVAAAVREHGVTVFPAVATMFRRLLDAPDVRLADFAGLRLAASGAAPCPWPLAQEWRERTGVRILRGYGMTELFRPISYLAGDAGERPDAIGRAVPGVELRVVDGEGRPVPPDVPGELWIRSPAAMDAYLDAPDDTRAVLAGGWFRTGDLARIGADGLVTIEGRLRERILRGGYSVFPPEVEAVLLAHPAVAEAAVVGIPDDDLGEEVAAFVVLRPGAAATADALTTWCRERLAAFKYPRRVAIEPELPRAATGKVLKRALLRWSGP
jgi:long-chain acyl-CoA synthetase